MAGLDWQAIHSQYLLEAQESRSTAEMRSVIARMIHLLPSSHLTVIPGELYRVPDAKRSTTAPPTKPGTKTNDLSADDAWDEDESGSTGLTLEVINGGVVVVAVEANSPGAKANVHPGWVIDSVDSQSTRDLFTSFAGAQQTTKTSLIPQIVESWLNGPPHSEVKLSFITGDEKSVEHTLVRETVAGEAVRFGNLPPEHVRIERRMLENDVGYIRLNLFLDPVQ